MRKQAAFLSLFLVFLLNHASFIQSEGEAAPANPYPMEIIQPDGTKLVILKRGDEFQNWTETKDGYTITQNRKTRFWEYARENKTGSLEPSGVKVEKERKNLPQGLKKSLKPKSSRERNRDFKKLIVDHQKDLRPVLYESLTSSPDGNPVYGAASTTSPTDSTGIPTR